MCLSILSCSHFCFINDILVKFKEIGKKGGEITNFTLFGLCQNQRQSSSKAPVYSRVKDMFHHKTSAQILMQSGKKVDATHRSPPPGIWYAAERCPRLIHLHWVHQSREGEDAHGNEQKQTAHLNHDRRVRVNCSAHSRSDINIFINLGLTTGGSREQGGGGLVNWQKKRLVGFMIWFLIYSYDLWNLNTSFILEWRHYPRLSYQRWFVFHLYLIISSTLTSSF